MLKGDMGGSNLLPARNYWHGPSTPVVTSKPTGLSSLPTDNKSQLPPGPAPMSAALLARVRGMMQSADMNVGNAQAQQSAGLKAALTDWHGQRAANQYGANQAYASGLALLGGHGLGRSGLGSGEAYYGQRNLAAADANAAADYAQKAAALQEMVRQAQQARNLTGQQVEEMKASQNTPSALFSNYVNGL